MSVLTTHDARRRDLLGPGVANLKAADENEKELFE